MTEVSLITLIGLPGMGKTTLCEELKKCDSYSLVHVCYDFFIQFDPDLSFTYKMKRRDMLEKIKELVASIKDKNIVTEMFRKFSRICKDNKRFIILIDDNNYYQSMRYDFYKIAREFKISFAQIYFCLPLNVALMQNSQRKDPIPEEVVVKMNNRIESPSEKNKWEINTFVINNTEINLEHIFNFIDKSFNEIVEESENKHEAAEQSMLHKIDLLLRKQVGFVLKNCKSESKDIQSLATQLNNKRKEILRDVRNGVIEIKNEDFTHLINLI